VRRGWKDGGECADAFEAEDAACLNGRFVDARDAVCVAFFFGRVGEEALW
jgi:hypothetical protein